MKKFRIIAPAVVLAALALFIYFRFYFVFGEGVKSGELNYVVYKGVIFKTYEGKLIQSGIRSKTARDDPSPTNSNFRCATRSWPGG